MNAHVACLLRRLSVCVIAAAMLGCSSSTATPPTTTLSLFDQPAGAVQHSGLNGWTMLIDPAWTTIGIPDFEEEIAWRTGGGSVDSFQSNISIYVDFQPAGLDLATYVAGNRKQFGEFDNGATISTGILTTPAGLKMGRIEYTATIGVDLHGVVYMVKFGESFVTATFVAPPEFFETEAPTIERYLATLNVPETD